MASNLDIALYQNDLQIRDGDFIIGESDEQQVADTINAFPGWWKQFPADGVGILRYVHSAGQEQALGRSIKINLTSDGFIVNNPFIQTSDSGMLTVNPNATRPE